MSASSPFTLSDELLRSALNMQPDDELARDIAGSVAGLIARTPQRRRSPIAWPWMLGLPGVPSAANRGLKTVAVMVAAGLLIALSIAIVAMSGAFRTQWKPLGTIFLMSNGDLLTQNADGTGVRTLARGLAETASVTVSPDGSRLAYWTTYDATYPTTVQVVDIASGAHRVVSGPASLYPGQHTELCWSPDGRSVAFAGALGTGLAQLYVAAADGSEVRAIVSDVIASSPSWSPDGTRVAFRGVDPRDLGSSGLYVVNADGSGLHRLVQRTAGEPQSIDFIRAAWSPDGSMIAYPEYAGLTTLSYDLHVVDVAGGGTWTVSAERTDEAWPSFSPDGRWLAFVASPHDAGPSDLVIARPDGSERRVIHLDVESFAWAPDASHVLVHTPEAMWQVAVDGSGQTVVPAPSDSCCVVWMTTKSTP